MVAQRPFFIGKPGWVRSSAWICDFSSTDNTTACAGGSTHGPGLWPARGQAPRSTMSRSLVANWRSRDSLNWRTRCGWSPWVCQIRCTELTLIPTCLAIIWAVQWVTSPGGSVCVSATVRSCTVAGSRGIRDGRVLSRSSPSTPCAMKRSCQRHTVTLLLPVWRMIVVVPTPSAVISTMRARHTCFCGLFRSATIAAKRSRSALFTSTVIPWRMPGPHYPPSRVYTSEDSFVRFYPLDVDRRQRGPAADQVGRLFGDHDDRRVDVTADEVRHYRGIDDAQRVDTQHSELGVDDSIRIARPTHLASAERMVNGDRGGADMGVDVGVGPAIAPRRDLFRGECGQGRLSTDLAREAQTGAQRGPVLLGGEEILPDAGGNTRIL